MKAILVLALLAVAPSLSFAQGLVKETAESLKGVRTLPTRQQTSLPDRVDLSAFMPTPGDQGRQGSCSAWAVAYARAYYQARSYKSRQGFKPELNFPSPSYIYRAANAFNMCEFGISISDGLKLLKKHGAASWGSFPYDATNCKALSPAENAAGTDFRIYDFDYIPKGTSQKAASDILSTIKAELADGNPVIFSMETTDAFDDLKRGMIYDHPTACTRKWKECGHAMVFVGYDDKKHALKLINSWGTKWADGGFAWVDYETARSALHGAFVIRMERTKPTIVNFQLLDAQVDEGQIILLEFDVRDAESLEISGIGDVTQNRGRCYGQNLCDRVVVEYVSKNEDRLTGHAKIRLYDSTSFTITATNPIGTSTAVLDFKVIPAPPPPPKPPRKKYEGEEKI